MTFPTLTDGAVGTELLRGGLALQNGCDSANLQHPELVARVHRTYRRAGADILTTNTFGANRFRLARVDLPDKTAEINRAGVALARSAAQGATVAGSIGPTGEQKDLPASERLRAAYREQAAALEGVDLYTCETFGDVRELRAAIQGIADVSNRPIFAQMTYTADGCTPLGLTPRDVVDEISDLPIHAIGVNCAVGEPTVEQVLAELGEATDLPLVARPNAGQPRMLRGAWIYPIGPAAFADLIARLAGQAAIVGGCCGTTPAHIAAARQRFEPLGQAVPG
ncbi:MAG TPA: homocysteine S-methyltransferase family protein [Chloroflexota bacterium]